MGILRSHGGEKDCKLIGWFIADALAKNQYSEIAYQSAGYVLYYFIKRVLNGICYEHV